MHYVYVLYTKSFNKIYVGYTSQPEGRLIAHNHPSNKGWTKRYQPWAMLYTESFTTKGEAMAREKELKSYQGREFIRTTLIPKYG